ncbi:MAG: hypothetical protein R2752_20105 [Vicinamibacterales bacterium]
MSELRWGRCIEHRGDDARTFVAEYFAGTGRRVALVAGGGFDPRAVALFEELLAVCKSLRVLLLREERPEPARELLERATANLNRFAADKVEVTIAKVEIFGPDNAVVGGRNAVNAVAAYSLEGVTDVVVDVSALSVGTSYPIVRYLREQIAREAKNLHVFVALDPALDEAIRPVASDSVGFVHGFRGRWALDSTSGAAKLWMPQLARGRNSALQRIHDFPRAARHVSDCPVPFTPPSAG